MRMIGLLTAFVALLATTPRPAHALLACAAPSDLSALAEVRALLAQQCDCASAINSRVYLRCAIAVANLAVVQDRLTPACAKSLRKCASVSTCGRPGAVSCCRTTADGRKKCSIKKNPSLCRAPSGGTACVGQLASCCDACDPGGSCVLPQDPTTTTTPTPSTTLPTLPPTTTTTPPSGPVCGNDIRESGEVCDCGPGGCDFGGATCPGGSANGAFLQCVSNCHVIDTSGCPGAGTTTSTVRPPGSTTTSSTSTSTTSTSTSSTLPPVQCKDPILHLPPLLNIPLETVTGSANCGGPGFVPPASSPSVGTVQDGSNHTLASLGANCLYAGAGNAAVSGLEIPAGNETVVSIVGLRGTKAIFGPSDGDGPGRHCLDGRPGRDGQGTCVGDGDCSGTPGSCALDANCFFAPPLAIPDVLPGVNACAVSTALEDFCGDLDIIGFATTVRGALANRIYLSACPTCVSARCVGGPRNGQRCTASNAGTSVDCLPDPSTFLGSFAANVALSSGQTTLANTNGLFCPGQTVPGAFGVPAARKINTDGTPPNLFTLQATIAGPFCVAPTGNPLVDSTVGLPAPAAVGAKAKINLVDVLRLFGR